MASTDGGRRMWWRRRRQLALLAVAVFVLVVPVGGVLLGADDLLWANGEDAAVSCDVTLTVDEAAQAQVERHPPGTTFCLEAGVHRGWSVQPRDGDRFVGNGDAVLSGATVIEGFVADGDRWRAPAVPLSAAPSGRCEPGHPRCARPEELFVDDARLDHVGSLDDVTSGTWFHDDEAGVLWLGDDPADKTVELATVPHAFTGDVDDVELRSLTVERYANPAQTGAIFPGGPGEHTASGWLLSDVTARQNHGAGLAFPRHERITVIDSVFTANGQLGLGGTGVGHVVERNEIAHNNAAHFDAGWAAGGAKFAFTTDLVVRGNHVHDNLGPGLWTDIDNVGTRYEANLVEDNSDAGIFHEISFDAVIEDNVVRGNGRRLAGRWCFGAGIQIAASANVEVRGNTVVGNQHSIMGIQQDRGGGELGAWEIRNLHVHDNLIEGAPGAGSQTGACTDYGAPYDSPAWNVRFEANDYFGTDNAWAWDQRLLDSFEEWQRFGLDVEGSWDPDGSVPD